MTLQQFFNGVYTYKYDPAGRDVWSWPTLDKNGELHDDCEGAALGVLLHVVCKGSFKRFWYELIFGDAKIHFCTINGQGHAVLHHNGLYTDNIQQCWVDKGTLIEDTYEFHPWSYAWWQVVGKLLIGRFYT